MTDETNDAEPSGASGGSAGEPVAWSVAFGEVVGDHYTTDQRKAESWRDACANVVPLYRSPTLTDAEREAIRRLGPSADPLASFTVTLTPAERAVFYGLLERLG